jgi:hypothetical protein
VGSRGMMGSLTGKVDPQPSIDPAPSFPNTSDPSDREHGRQLLTVVFPFQVGASIGKSPSAADGLVADRDPRYAPWRRCWLE